jgi:hypothetical protein
MEIVVGRGENQSLWHQRVTTLKQSQNRSQDEIQSLTQTFWDEEQSCELNAS